MDTLPLTDLYTATLGSPPAHVERLDGAGSNRKYFRLTASDHTIPSLIGCIGTDPEENKCFVQLATQMEQRALPVPHVVAISNDARCYIQQDLGNRSLYDALSAGRQAGGHYQETEQQLLEQAVRLLADVQFRCADPSIYACFYPIKEMDARGVMFDLNYFKYCFLKLSGIEFNENLLQDDFEKLLSDLLSTPSNHIALQYRDYQARNLMLTAEHQLVLIDFQGARRGPIHYDLASFLWQASARYPQALRNHLTAVYMQAARHYTDINEADFIRRLHLFALFRTLQVLGAYGFRGLWEKKTYFINSIPLALDNLSVLLEQGICEPYPTLERVCRQLIQHS